MVYTDTDIDSQYTLSDDPFQPPIAPVRMWSGNGDGSVYVVSSDEMRRGQGKPGRR
jgi:hypothetical protein